MSIGSCDEKELKACDEKCFVNEYNGWKGRLKKIWIDCVRLDIKEKDLNDKGTSNRGKSKRKTYCSATPKPPST